MRFWPKDDILRRVLRNTGQMGAGKVAGAVLHLASIAVTARILDLTEFGLLMLFRSIAQTVVAIAKFQSWQAFVHFGADPFEARAYGAVRALWWRLATIDFVAGGAAVAIGAGFLLAASDLVSIPPAFAPLAAVYLLIVPLQVAGTPTGLLRLTDRFDLVAWQSLVTPAVRLAGVGIAWLLGAPLWAVVLAWVLSDILGDGFLWVCAVAVARRIGILGGAADDAPAAPAPGARVVQWRYLAGTNVIATMQQGALPVMTLVIGAILGAPAAGAYRFAQSLLDAVLAPAELAMRSLFPEISKLRLAKGNRLRDIMRHVCLIALCVSVPVGAVMFFGADLLVWLLAGEKFASSGALLSILAFTVPALFLAAIFETLMLGSGKSLSPVLSRATILGLALGVIAVLGDRLGLADVGVVLVIASYAGLAVLAVPTALALRAGADEGT
jgi:O-antigen/teichoic acid export membrane protein